MQAKADRRLRGDMDRTPPWKRKANPKADKNLQPREPSVAPPDYLLSLRKHAKRRGFWGQRPRQQRLLDEYWSRSAVKKAIEGRGLGAGIGIDFGGVISEFDPAQWNAAGQIGSAVPGAFRAISALVKHFGAANAFIVSKAGERKARESTSWMRRMRLFERTGLLEQNVFYVRLREDKRAVAEKLALTHFVDDRWSVLSHLSCCSRRYVIPSSANDIDVPTRLVEDGSVVVGGWESVLADMRLIRSSQCCKSGSG